MCLKELQPPTLESIRKDIIASLEKAKEPHLSMLEYIILLQATKQPIEAIECTCVEEGCPASMNNRADCFLSNDFKCKNYIPLDSEYRKPCPFCGDKEPFLNELDQGYSIDCMECGMGHTESNHTKEAAIKSWNTRV